MRMLFSTTAGAGHFGPMVPLARACVAAGHEVVVAAPESFADSVAREGLAHAGFADVPPEVLGPVFARLPALPPQEANTIVIQEVFGRLDAQAALPGLTTMLRDWTPDLVVREPCELGSLVAAEAAGVPHAQVSIGVTAAESTYADKFVEPLVELCALGGVAPDQAITALRTAPRFSCVPALLDDVGREARGGDAAEGGALHRFRADAPPPSGALPPPWGDPDQPLVYVSYGSVTATMGRFGSLYPATLAALAELPVRVLMTTGSGIDPADLAPLPPNARVESWLPQHDVLPHAAAVVAHGGFGTTMAALAAGVPQVVVPLFAYDQTVNAHHVAAVGAGVHLESGSTVEGLAPALTEILETPGYAARAAEVASEMAALPPVAGCVPLLEALAASA